MGLPEYEVWVLTACIMMFSDSPSDTPTKQTLHLIHFFYYLGVYLMMLAVRYASEDKIISNKYSGTNTF
jgi:hypothetical protein